MKENLAEQMELDFAEEEEVVGEKRSFPKGPRMNAVLLTHARKEADAFCDRLYDRTEKTKSDKRHKERLTRIFSNNPFVRHNTIRPIYGFVLYFLNATKEDTLTKLQEREGKEYITKLYGILEDTLANMDIMTMTWEYDFSPKDLDNDSDYIPSQMIGSTVKKILKKTYGVTEKPLLCLITTCVKLFNAEKTRVDKENKRRDFYSLSCVTKSMTYFVPPILEMDKARSEDKKNVKKTRTRKEKESN
jgi:hypothetical protein